jgi:hypothetical protein
MIVDRRHFDIAVAQQLDERVDLAAGSRVEDFFVPREISKTAAFA